MNKHNIIASNYLDAFVLALAKRGVDILADWMGVGKEVRINMVGNPVYAKATQHLHVWHMSTGVVGEALELFQFNIEFNEDSSFQEEISDVLFYLVGMSRYVGIDDWQSVFCDFDAYLRPVGDVVSIPQEQIQDFLLSAMRLDDMCKKYNVYNDEEKLKNAKEFWLQFAASWELIAVYFFSSLQEVIDCNVEKLSKRYEGIKYSNEAASSRLDKLDSFPSGT